MTRTKIFHAAMRIIAVAVALASLIFIPTFMVVGGIINDDALLWCGTLGYLQLCIYGPEGLDAVMKIWEDQ